MAKKQKEVEAALTFLKETSKGKYGPIKENDLKYARYDFTTIIPEDIYIYSIS